MVRYSLRSTSHTCERLSCILRTLTLRSRPNGCRCNALTLTPPLPKRLDLRQIHLVHDDESIELSGAVQGKESYRTSNCTQHGLICPIYTSFSIFQR